ncbi:hypothetical protein ACP4OV_025568 [Aristida adscensionis]
MTGGAAEATEEPTSSSYARYIPIGLAVVGLTVRLLCIGLAPAVAVTTTAVSGAVAVGWDKYLQGLQLADADLE